MRYFLFFLSLPLLIISQQEIIVKPYLQNASPNSMTIMWEYSQIDDGEVEWGISQNLENSTTATFENSQNNNYIFTAVINNLSPNTKYFYRTVNNNIYDFKQGE